MQPFSALLDAVSKLCRNTLNSEQIGKRQASMVMARALHKHQGMSEQPTALSCHTSRLESTETQMHALTQLNELRKQLYYPSLVFMISIVMCNFHSKNTQLILNMYNQDLALRIQGRKRKTTNFARASQHVNLYFSDN